MRKLPIGFVLLTIFFTFPVFAENLAMPPVVIPTAASNGFGGHHVAYTDNVFSLLVNPAAMMRTQQRSFFTLAPSIINPQTTYDLAGALVDLGKGDTSALGSAADTLSEQKGKIVLGMDLREFPLSIAWVANGFGFGLWNRTFVTAKIIGTHIEAEVYSDVMLPIGFALKIFNFERHSLDVGFTMKPFARAIASKDQKITDLISGNTSDFIDSINVPVIVGGSFDSGLMYRWAGGLGIGFTFSDFYSRGNVVYNINNSVEDTNTYYIPFTMNLGLSYELKLGKIFGIALAADWRDIANYFKQDDYFNRNYALDFGVGAQLSLFETIRFRAGMSEMLPSVGVGFDFGPLKIDLAYYGKEFGLEPGQLSVAMAELSIAIRPGAQKRSWPWARRSIVGLITGLETVEAE